MYNAVQALLSDGSRDVNEIDSCGFSPLHYTAKHNHAEVTSLLLDYGAGDVTWPPSWLNLAYNCLLVSLCYLNQHGGRNFVISHF